MVSLWTTFQILLVAGGVDPGRLKRGVPQTDRVQRPGYRRRPLADSAINFCSRFWRVFSCFALTTHQAMVFR